MVDGQRSPGEALSTPLRRVAERFGAVPRRWLPPQGLTATAVGEVALPFGRAGARGGEGFAPLAAAEKPPVEEPLEKMLARLEDAVERLESGKESLEKSIDVYVEGRRLGTECLKRLAQLEERVRVVVEKADGTLDVQDFEGEAVSEE